MQNKIVILPVMTVVIVVLIGGIMAFVRARNTSSVSSCINHLRQLDAATQTWAVEYHKTTNDIPSWEILRPYLKGDGLVCPQGGKYTLERIDKPPTCSIGGPSHTLQ